MTPPLSTLTRRSPKPTTDDMVSLAERIGYLQAMRVAFTVVVLGAAFFASQLVSADTSEIIISSAGYLIGSAACDVIRRLGKGRSLPIVGGMLLIDGLYLAWAMYATGGTQSPLRFLVYLHLIGVTLLASPRTGLKIALWHSLLFFVVFYAQVSGWLIATDGISDLRPGSGEFTRVSVFNVAAFWLVATGTTAFSSLNERELRRRKGDLEDLAAMAAALEDENDPRSVAQILLDRVGDSFGFKRGVVLGASEGDAPLLAHRGPGDAGAHAEGVDDVVKRSWTTKQTILLKRWEETKDPRLATLLPFARNIIVVPLFADGEKVGALVLEHPQGAGHRVERRVVTMVGQFASHGALALRNSYLIQQVQRMADTDGLTGIANRRTFEATLEKELSRATRNGEPVTLLMVDVDHFKMFNDTYGHQAGDEVLRLVGATLGDACRNFDTPARYGGEEFAVILPACSAPESLVVAERLRELVCGIETVAPVRASAGVATFPTHAGDPESLIKAADEALYESKRSGRDRLSRSRRRAGGGDHVPLHSEENPQPYL